MVFKPSSSSISKYRKIIILDKNRINNNNNNKNKNNIL